MGEDFINRRNIHWFPGHMAKTLRKIKEMLPLVDAVVQVLDARIPAASLNPDLQAVYGNKPRLYVLNKNDLADDNATQQWLAFFLAEGSAAVSLNSKEKAAFTAVRAAVQSALAQLLQRRRIKGMQGAPTRLMVTGIPNVGKSTFINNWLGKASAKAANKPGVTRGQQWLSAGAYQLLDMPGVLCKSFAQPVTAVNLAIIGAIPSTLLNNEEIAAGLLEQIKQPYKNQLKARFKLTDEQVKQDGWDILAYCAKNRGMLLAGGGANTERAAIVVLDEFRAAKLGRVTLEWPANTTQLPLRIAVENML